MRRPWSRWLHRVFSGRRAVETARQTAGEGDLAVGNSLFCGASDRGRVRENNEDAFACAPRRGLYVVADGMGGEMAGEQASALAVATLTEVLTAERIEQASGEAGGDVEALLREALHEAQEAVTSLASAHPDWGRIGTTAVVALLRGDRLHVANVGDSRAYLLNGGQPQLLTRDHSIAAALAEQGQLTAEEARRHHLRNQLTAFLGMSQPLKPAYAQIQMRPGDRVVLCSDGLWDMLSDEEIARIASELPDPRAATRALIDAANHAGGRDNITVIVVTRQDEEGCGGLIPNGDTVVITGRDP